LREIREGVYEGMFLAFSARFYKRLRIKEGEEKVDRSETKEI
jgi:hypothetical protein